MAVYTERTRLQEIKAETSEWGAKRIYYFSVVDGEIEPIGVTVEPQEPYEDSTTRNIRWKDVPDEVEDTIREKYQVDLDEENPYEVGSDDAFSLEMDKAREFFVNHTIIHGNSDVIPEQYREESTFFLKSKIKPALVRHFIDQRERCTFGGLGEIDEIDFTKIKVR